MHALDDISRHRKEAFGQLSTLTNVINIKLYQVIGLPEYNIGKKELTTQKHLIFFKCHSFYLPTSTVTKK